MTEYARISVFDEDTLHALRKAGFTEVEVVRDENGHEFLIFVRR